MSSVGEVHNFFCKEPSSLIVWVDNQGRLTLNGKGEELRTDKFSVGSLAGFQMALDGLAEKGFPGFKQGDTVKITCTGLKETDKGNPMPEFTIQVERDE